MAGDERAEQSEFEALSRHVKKGRLLSTWEAKHIDNEVLARISEHMAKGLDVDTAIDVTRRMRRVMDNGQEFWADPDPDDPDFWSNPAGGGGFTKFPHDAEDIQVGKGAHSIPIHPVVSADIVYDQMLKNFPPESIEWIKEQRWTGPVDLSPALINLSDESKWAAAHESDKVHKFMERIQAGDLPKPSVAVLEPSDHKVNLVDGHHRALAYLNLGLPPRMYIGRTHSSNGPWAETHSSQIHHGSDPQNKGWGPQGPIAAGIAVQAADSGRVLMLQRSVSDGDPAAGMWEFPGGCLENAESPAMGAVREWQEETGMQLPFGRLKGKWLSKDGKYRGLVYEIPSEESIDLGDGRDQVINPDDPDGDAFESLAWWDVDHLADNPAIRPEILENLDGLLSALGTDNATKAAVLHKASSQGNPNALRRWYDEGAGGQIDWGQPGDHAQCVAVASQYMSEDQAHGFCQLREISATGDATATHAAQERRGA